MKTVDTRGQQCPAPLIATRKALKESESGESFKIITNSKNACENISRFLKDNRTYFEIKEKEGLFSIIITRSTDSGPDKNDLDSCNPNTPYFKKSDHES